jgi:hypothetical protein
VFWQKRYVGRFATPDEASAAHTSVQKDLDNAELSMLTADEVNAAFDKAKTKVSFPAFVPEERDLPRGVHKRPSGKCQSEIYGVEAKKLCWYV